MLEQVKELQSNQVLEHKTIQNKILKYTYNQVYDGIVGSSHFLAISYDNSAILGWATGCQVTRGYQDIANPIVLASYGTEQNVVGTASESTTDVVSLGDHGSAVLTFSTPIVNTTGYDFAVFENSLNDIFLELAFVEVSSDGIHYFRALLS